MRLNIISGLFLICSAIQPTFAQNKIDCTEFKTGKYHYSPKSGGEVTIKRTKKKQTERYNNENQKFIFDIIWTDECSYELTLIKTKGLPKEKRKEILGTKLICQVTSSSLGHYDVEITSEGSEKMEEVTIYSNR